MELDAFIFFYHIKMINFIDDLLNEEKKTFIMKLYND